MRGTAPLAAAAAVFLLGALTMALTIVPWPLGLPDIDDDGVSDLYQDISVLKDLRLTSEGEWVEQEVGTTSEMDLPFLLFVSILVLLALPVTTFLYITSAPFRKAERERRARASIMQDNVRRLSAFLEINPSLLSALKCSHLSQSGKEGRLLGKVLWEVRCKGRTFEECMGELSEEWGKEEPMLGRALDGLRTAELEPSEEEVQSSARRVVERLSEESRERMEAYGRSLSAPSTALFGLGVLLPVLLATMVPLAGIGGRTTYMVGLFLWVILPASILAFGGHLVRKRPRFFASTFRPNRTRIAPNALNVPTLVVGGAMFAIALLRLIAGNEMISLRWAGSSSLESYILLLLCGAALSGAAVIDMVSRDGAGARERDEVLSRSLPDLLNGIGSSLMEGRSFESAIRRAAKGCDGPLRVELSKAFPVPGVVGQISGAGGLDKAIMSSREFSRAGPEPGGRAVRALSRHLSELSRLEREMRERVRSSIGQMEVTSSVFAPLMIGSSAGIFKLMEGSTSALEGGSMVLSTGGETMAGSTFLVLSGGYLMILSVVTALTFHRLEQGVETGGWERVPKRLVQSAIAFTTGAVLSSLLLGG